MLLSTDASGSGASLVAAVVQRELEEKQKAQTDRRASYIPKDIILDSNNNASKKGSSTAVAAAVVATK